MTGGAVVDDGTVGALVRRARAGDQDAWDALVERFSPLVAAVCRRFALGEADLLDVGQSVWLALLEHLDDLREAQALPGWIATTTRRECLQIVSGKGGRQRLELVGEFDVPGGDPADDVTDLVVTAERQAALREAFRSLSAQHQQLLLLLLHEPPLPYVEIGRRLGIAVGSIGPTRGRCIQRLRAHPAVRALTEQGNEPGDEQGNEQGAAHGARTRTRETGRHR
ncbi:MAG: RNA polymerase sigma factor [Kineosporiaceae bacterium]